MRPEDEIAELKAEITRLNRALERSAEAITDQLMSKLYFLGKVDPDRLCPDLDKLFPELDALVAMLPPLELPPLETGDSMKDPNAPPPVPREGFDDPPDIPSKG